MRYNETTAAEEYTRRVLPQLGGLYCAAHAMTGSRENAEVLLCTALSDYFAMNDVLSARASLRSGILREMKNRALSMRQEEKRAPETDFSGLTIPRDAQGRPESTPLLDSLTQLPAQTQRLLILKYGCQLPAHAIAQLLETEPEEVKRALGKTRRQLIRVQGLQKEHTAAFEQELTREIRRAMSKTGGEQVDVTQILRTLEEDIAAVHVSRHWAGRAIRGMLLTLLIAVLVAAVWVVAVLMEM